ncbi:MAG: dihydroorotate dehydrogenase [OM182 bacterium BACL3 MAG-120920-bin41]|uniref:Dihydroorotate dehydrogenase n=5 Tax=OM182 clade TaxID=745002 RepID=A0A0R2SL94_9GAMM|nr:MAG: dihydroorotate dehydrogenase [OM182 bacterium BACL3 MAG-120507-bin80]KRO84470.1 MAG: dihydroorotate dehydrogenase [OM182 bacterium BACL3 MAG-120619-bin3]KRO84935.1 MAG: dihydroorotate dehydrogenase [OM182 bacterium BACL3 MAG-120920-bin41]KRP28423.1 MAG: dihydroorotate dehydrogenase [OM182 bacterium BACL3 MAG-120924-bin41]KRP39193.1 MAG: dihydroorotate dehydrogenase [OM182 bacterium BACL3 MAG-120531-bin86]
MPIRLDSEGLPTSGITANEDASARINAALAGNDLTWVHLDINEASSKEWADAELTFLDPLTLDALFAEETRPRILEFDTGTLLILRGVNLNADAEPEDMVSIRLWIDSSRIISVRKRRLKAVTDLRERIEAGVGPHNAGDFITQLTSRLFERMEPVFTELDELLDDAEERVMEAADTKYRSQITDIRKQAIVFRRYIAPQRDVIAALRVSDMPWLSELHKRRLQESLDRVIRYIEDIDTIRERAQIVKDELTNALSDKMNKNLYLLSVIAAVFLPLGFLTGLLGINVGGVPGVDDPSAFWVFSGFLSVVVALQILLFKRWKWF